MVAVFRLDEDFKTNIKGIFPTLEDAKRHYQSNFFYQEFNFGEVNLDIYNKECYYWNENEQKSFYNKLYSLINI